MNKPLNLNQAKALIKKYRSFSKEDIEEVWKTLENPYASTVAEELTGFGGVRLCTLCQAVPKLHPKSMCPNCAFCIYGKSDGTMGCYKVNAEAERTYDAINNATSPSALLWAFKARANFIEEWIKQFE